MTHRLTKRRTASPSRRVTTMATGLIALLALLVTSMAALNGTASAAVPGLQRVERATPADSPPAIDKFVSCPTGTKMISGGGSVSGGVGRVILDGIQLKSFVDGVTTRAFEQPAGTNLNWTLKADAMCAKPLKGLVQVDATSPSNSFGKSVFAKCPTGKQLVGVGAETSGGVGQVEIDDLIPSSTQVEATGFETEGGTNANWSITAHAMCAAPLPGYEIRKLATDFGSFNGSGVTETCSAGKKVLGVGGEITGGLGQVSMDSITPNANLTSVNVHAQEDGNGTDNNWNVTGYAICATP
jgi:hypothetical protein